jgi:hypothetical protein
MPENRIELKIVASGSEEASRVLAAVGAAGGKLGSITASGAAQAERALGSMGDTAKQVFAIFTGVSLGNLFVEAAGKVKGLVVEMITLGAQARVQEEAFRLVAESVSASSTALSSALQHASSGLVNQSDTMLASARALQQGLNPDQLVSLMEIARSQAKLTGATVTQAFNDITLAVTNQQTRQLKAYGIIIDSARAFDKYAESLGTVAGALTEAGQSQAIMIATQEALKGKLLTADTEILKQAEAVERLRVGWQELKESVGKNIVEMLLSIGKLTVETVDNVEKIGQHVADNSWLVKAKDNYFAFFDWLDQQSGRTGSKFDPGRQVPSQAAMGRTASLFTDQELNALRAMPDLLDDIAGNARPATNMVDLLKAALAHADEVMKQLTAGTQIGTATAAQFAQGIQGEITALRTMADQTPALKAKILDLQVTLAATNFQQLQQNLTQATQAATLALQADLNAVKGNNAARLISDEEATNDENALREAFSRGEVVRLAQVLAASQLNETQRLAFTMQYEAAKAAASAAGSANTIALAQQETVQLKTEFANRAIAQQAAADMALAGVAETQDAQVAALKNATVAMITNELDAVAQLEQIDRAGAAARLAIQTNLIEQKKQLLAAQFIAGTIPYAAYSQAISTLDAALQGVLIASDKATQDAKKASLAGYTAFAAAENQRRIDADNAIWATENAGLMAVINGLTSVQVQANNDTIASIQKLLDGGNIDFKKAEEYRTSIVDLQSKNRIARYLSESDKRKEFLIADTNEHAKAIEQQNTASQRQADANLALLAQQQRAQGDYFGFLGTQFGLALSKGTDLWNALTTLGQDTANALKSGFSDFFTTFANDLIAGKGMWASFTDAMGSLWHQLMNSMIKAVSDFLATAVVQQLGNFVLGLLGGSSAGLGGALGAGLAAALGLAGSAAGGGAGTAAAGTSSVSLITETLGLIKTFFSGFYSQIVSLLPQSVQTALTNIGASVSSLFSSTNTAGVAIDEFSVQAAQTSGALSGLGPAFSALGTVLAVAGAAYGAANLALGVYTGTITAASGALTGAGVGAAIGTLVFPGVGTAIGAVAGAALGALIGSGIIPGTKQGGFSGLSNSILTTEPSITILTAGTLNSLNYLMGGIFKPDPMTHAQREALETARVTNQLQPMVGTLANYIRTPQALFDFLGAIGKPPGQGGFPTTVESFLNIPGQGPTTIGAGTAALHPELPTIQDAQEVARIISEHPDWLSLQVQAGISTDKLLALNQVLHDLTVQVLAATVALQEAEDKAFGGLKDQADLFLPPDIAAKFAVTVDALRAQWDALVGDASKSNLEIKGSLEAIQAQLQQYNAAISVYVQIQDDIASITGGIAMQTKEAISIWQQALTQLDDIVTTAQDALTTAQEAFLADPTVSVDAFLKAEVDLRNAVLARYEAEKQAVLSIEASISTILQNIAAPLLDLGRTIGSIETASTGATATFQAMLTVLLDTATSSLSLSERLFAVQQGISTIIAGSQALVAFAAANPTNADTRYSVTGSSVDTLALIVQDIATAAAPFINQFTAMIHDAVASGDLQGALALLQQEAVEVQALGQAAVDSVNAWADAAIQGVNDTLQAQLDANALTRDALNEQIATIQDWQGSLQSASQFVLGLQLGAGSPLSAAEQLALVQGTYNAALSTFNADVTPANLSALQAAGQSLLQVAQAQMVDSTGAPTADFTALVSSLISDMNAAIAKAPVSGDLDAQLAALQDQVAALDTLDQTLQDSAQLQIDAINLARDAEIQIIQTGVADQLTIIATQQADLTGQLLAQQLDLLSAITGGLDSGSYLALKAGETVTALQAIQADLAAFLSGQPLPTGSTEAVPVLGSFASGTNYVPTTGIYQLHEGEGVTPAGQTAPAPQEITVNVPIYLDSKLLGNAVVKVMNADARAGKPSLVAEASFAPVRR